MSDVTVRHSPLTTHQSYFSAVFVGGTSAFACFRISREFSGVDRPTSQFSSAATGTFSFSASSAWDNPAMTRAALSSWAKGPANGPILRYQNFSGRAVPPAFAVASDGVPTL